MTTQPDKPDTVKDYGEPWSKRRVAFHDRDGNHIGAFTEGAIERGYDDRTLTAVNFCANLTFPDGDVTGLGLQIVEFVQACCADEIYPMLDLCQKYGLDADEAFKTNHLGRTEVVARALLRKLGMEVPK